MSETHPMDYYGRIRELEARAAKLESERGRLGNDAQQGLANERALHDALLWAHEWHLKELPSPTPATQEAIERIERLRAERDEARARVAQLEAFIVDACREKTLHGSTPSLITGASKLGIAAFEAWWAERAAEETKP